jgi:E1A/CREB-binding protein
MTDVQGLPYFEGDFWPNVIEEQIKELELEEERIATEANEAESQKLSSKRSSKKACKKAGKSKQPKKAGDLSQRLLSIMERHKEVFFVVRLNQEKAFAKTTDPDPLVTCDLMEGRDAFLTMAREKHWEFSSLRRAKFSTLSMLVQLHHSGSDRFIYHCNHCEKPIESRYTCSECEDFDLCEPCYNKVGHNHQMKKVGMGLVEIEQGGEPLDQREAVNRAIQRTVEALLHAAQCKDRNCKNNSCLKMKQVMYHVRRCRACPVCKQFMSLCMLHAKQCKDKDCTVPLCTNLKKRFQERQRESQIIQSRIMQRRMQLMRRDSSPSVAASSNTVAPSPAPSTPHPTQPSTPSTKAPAKNSPIPSPAISRNPGSVPPTASQPSPGPGGKTLNASQEPVHGPPSVPGKMMNSPSPHPRTMGGPTYASPVRSASSDLITMRKHPEHVLQHIPRHAASIPSTVPNNGGQYATQGYPTPQGSSTHMPHVYPNQAAYPGNPPANRMMSYQDRMQYAAHQRPNHMSRSTYGVQGMGHPTAMEMGTSPGMPHPQSRQAYTTQVHPHHQQQLVMQQQQQPQQRQMNMQTMQQQQRYPHPHQPTAGRYPQQYAQGPTPMHTQPPPQQTQHGDPTFNPGYQDSLQSNYSSQSGGDFLNQLSKLL